MESKNEWKDSLIAWIERSKKTTATYNEFTDLIAKLEDSDAGEEFLELGKRILDVGNRLGVAFQEQMEENEQFETRKEILESSRIAYIDRFRELLSKLAVPMDDATFKSTLFEVMSMYDFLRYTPFLTDSEKADGLEKIAEAFDILTTHMGAPAGVNKDWLLNIAGAMDHAHGMYTGGHMYVRPGMPLNLLGATYAHELIHALKAGGAIIRDIPIASAFGYFYRWYSEEKSKTYDEYPLDDWQHIKEIIKIWRGQLSDPKQRATTVNTLLQHYDKIQEEDEASYLAGIIVAAAAMEEFPNEEHGLQYLGRLGEGLSHEAAVAATRERNSLDREPPE